MERRIRPNADDHLRVTRERGNKHESEESSDKKRNRSKSPLGRRGRTQSDEELEAEGEAAQEEGRKERKENGFQTQEDLEEKRKTGKVTA